MRGGHSNTHCNHKRGCEFFLNRSLQNELLFIIEVGHADPGQTDGWR